MARQVVIDDTDPRIQYTGQGWFQDRGSQDNVGNFGPTYNKTSHGMSGDGSFSFSFEGTSVSIFGTNGGQFIPVFECFVDQISIGSTNSLGITENNWILCGDKTLNDGSHTVTLVISTGSTFWVDYLTYTPSPKVALDEAVLLVDNLDPSFLFDARWGELEGIANMTSVVGSKVKFDFIGKSVSWVGFIPTELPEAAAFGSFTVDGGQPVSFRLNGIPVPGIKADKLYNQVLFTTPELAPGPHSLVVTYNGGNGPSTPLTLDYCYVTNTSISQPTSSSIPQPVQPISQSATADTTSSSPSPTGGFRGDGSSYQSHKLPVGGIIGGAIGGLALVSLIIFLLCWLHRRRHAEETRSKRHTSEDGSPELKVNLLIPTQPESDTYVGSSRVSLAQPPDQPLAMSSPATISHKIGNQRGIAGQPWVMRDEEAEGSQPPVSNVVHHQDSGVRLLSAEQ